MGERIIVSGGGMLRELAAGRQKDVRKTGIEGAGALLSSGGRLYAAGDRGDVIWQLDSDSLIPLGLFAGGPGVCQMELSRDGARLYALCRDADSLVMLCAKSGTPLMLNRVGVAPCAMAMDESGSVLAVAGGACGEVVLVHTESLCVLKRLHTPGMVFSVLIADGCVYALSLDEKLSTVLSVFSFPEKRRQLALPGMPGTLARVCGQILAATHEGIFCVSSDGARVIGRWPVPGRAGRLIDTTMGLMMTDMWGEALYLHTPDGSWRRIAEQVRDAIILE